MIVLFQNTINDTTVGTGAQRRVAGWQFTASQTGHATTITLNFTAAGHQVKLGLYDRPTTAPGNLLGGESNLVTTVVGTNVFTLSAPAPLIAGNTYFLSPCASTSTTIFGADSSITVRRYNGQVLTAITDPLPNPYGTSTSTAGSRLPYLLIEATDVSIASVTPLVSGQLFTITFNDPTYIATSMGFSDGLVTNTVSLTNTGTPGEYTGTAPAWVDEQTGLAYGPVNLQATDGTKLTTVTASIYLAELGISIRILTSAAPNNYGAIANSPFSPALKANTQCRYTPAQVTVYADGTLDDGGTNFFGSTVVWDRDPDTGITRQCRVEIST
ncbi:hypothetical protein [Paenibacillus koleovorans]|uniref:hypothetical protein n=1 Tax=Paenibacillus koleovorans TaxID=121608 RepID=UPI000FD6DB04|nr:hypothetical protein [Paenibacillus koleovorans]